MSVAFLLLVAIASPARADTAAGREAFDKGDYNRAMVEWQSAADRNDPDAEFALGSIYEYGVGDLTQNYKQADYWYRKAAALGNIEAQYRLALIWASGGDDFAADLAEAYKWAALAVESKGLEGRAVREKGGAPGTIAPPSQPSAPAAEAPSTGCPGWPFPTLPCHRAVPRAAGDPNAAARANSSATDDQSPRRGAQRGAGKDRLRSVARSDFRAELREHLRHRAECR